jgi:hypothetical protein
VFRLGTRAALHGDNLAETRHLSMASKLSAPRGMDTTIVLDRFTPFKRDSARRIDRVIDYFGETQPTREARGESSRGLFVVRGLQSRSRTESGVSVTVSLSARTR